LIAVSPAEPSSSVWPSAGARTTASAPSMPLAPGLFSTTTGWPSETRSFSARSRAIVSTPPPGEKGTTMVMGLLG